MTDKNIDIEIKKHLKESGIDVEEMIKSLLVDGYIEIVLGEKDEQ